MTALNRDQYLCQTGFKVGDLHVEKLIPHMSEKERNYATYLILASWAGLPIIYDQVSRESIKIHNFLTNLFTSLSKEKLVNAFKQDEEKKTPMFYLIEYAATFYCNAGNFSGFGDTKFIPRLSKEELRELTPDNLKQLLDDCIDDIYSLENGKVELGYAPNGITSYYEPYDITEDEIIAINNIITQAKLKIENTKIIRESNRYCVSLPSIEIDETGKEIGKHNNLPVMLTKGRYSDILKIIVHWLTKAKEYVANDTQLKMLEKLIESYTTGSCDAHVEYSSLWVRDIDPPIEYYNGFIESYRDPSGIRAEYESFVSCVDPKESRLLHKFVESSQIVLPLLPYTPEYERKTFNPPSYNALNILTFVTSSLPIGINIPNYEEVREHIGFKNVSLTNVINASEISRDSLTFLNDKDAETVMKYYSDADNIATASHELYGHGSAKLLREEDVKSGKVPDLLNPNRVVKTFYKEGETAEKAMGGIYSAFEECRAEATSLYLAFFDEVSDIFEVNKDPNFRSEFLASAILGMLHAGLKGMAYYSAETRQWKQAHSCSRFAILKACMIWGRGSVDVIKTPDNRFELKLDRSNFEGVKDALECLLKHLNYFKSANLPVAARQFIGFLTSFDDFWLEVREFALKQKRSRYLYSGAVIKKEGESYTITSPTEGRSPNSVDLIYSIIQNYQLASNP